MFHCVRKTALNQIGNVAPLEIKPAENASEISLRLIAMDRDLAIRLLYLWGLLRDKKKSPQVRSRRSSRLVLTDRPISPMTQRYAASHSNRGLT